MKKLSVLAVGLQMIILSSLFAGVYAQGGADHSTIYVPVTFYDFHSDRTNPEFEQPHQGGLRTGAVRTTLDDQFKPVAGPNAAANRSMGVAQWFRDWNATEGMPYGKGSGVVPGYNPPAQPQFGYYPNPNNWESEYKVDVRFIGDIQAGHLSFENRVIKDSLLFRQVGNTTMYEFNNDKFFPLDGRGLGNQWHVKRYRDNDSTKGIEHDHNYSFAMELVYPFVAKNVANMEFRFRGDDDVWVFIDKNLVLDLGGIKEAKDGEGSFTLAGRGIQEGGRHTLRVFYVERHSDGSSIRIQTNIVAPPADIKLSTNPTDGLDQGSYINDGIISAGRVEDTVKVYAYIFDDKGVLIHPVDCDRINWTLTAADGTKTVIEKRCDIDVTTTVAGNMRIEATYTDPEDPSNPVTVGAGANFKPLPADSLWVMRDGFKDAPSFKEANAIDKDDRVFEAYFETNQNEVLLWIIEVDKYGNYVQDYGADANFPKVISWVIEDDRVVSVRRENTSGSKVALRRELAGEGLETEITFKGCVYPNPEVNVCRDREAQIVTGTAGEPAMVIGPNPFVPGTSLQGTLPQAVYDTYRNAIDASNTGGKGVLIAVDAPTKLKPVPGAKGNKQGFGRVMIYDAVGNLVHVGSLYQSTKYARSYGYVWDAKNTKGRRVGAGTYLVVVSGTEEESGKPFNPPRRKIGVKGTGKK